MPRRGNAFGADDVARLPGACATCLHWERRVDADAVGTIERSDGLGPEEIKRRWWLESLATRSVVGVVARAAPADDADGAIAGYVTYRVPTGNGDDALTVLALHVDAGCRGAGLGRALVQQVAREALRRPKVRSVEAVASRLPGAPCLVGLDFWLGCGFVVVDGHPLTPRVRLDARVLASWRTEVGEAVELAWDRFRGAVRPEPAPRPALTLRRR